MKRAHRSLLSLLAVLFCLSYAVAGLAVEDAKDGEEALRLFAKLQRGTSPEQVRELVGPPQRIARQILYHRYREQWIYDVAGLVRLTFDCRRGQKPQLILSELRP